MIYLIEQTVMKEINQKLIFLIKLELNFDMIDYSNNQVLKGNYKFKLSQTIYFMKFSKQFDYF